MGNPIYHGGVDQAVCVYPFQHYSYWRENLGLAMEIPSFGENITVEEWTEENVCIGDIFLLGGAVVQITQPRQPCFKLGNLHERADVAKLVLEAGYTGYYLRVLEEGFVKQGDEMKRITKDPAGLSIAWVNKIVFFDTENVEATKQLLAVESMATSLLERLKKRLRE